MKLKRLELVGFKSFADRTVFDFNKGLTCIVGPNGCGKSNVVDAFKWIMGEQSAKSLRGSEMQDVIFSGTSSRKPSGYAEATLVFTDMTDASDDGRSEIAVSRRLYRSGESEYLINRKLSRLKDVRELFFGTGLGRDAYSIIEQGKIDKILSINPAERRTVFEEAAGIMRYKVKKDEAVRRLERVSDNLARLKDILDEVASRTRSVKIQAGKARRFKEISGKLSVFKRDYALFRMDTLSNERAGIEAGLDEKNASAENLRKKVRNISAGLQDAEEEYIRIADDVNALRQRLASCDGEMRTLDEKIVHSTRRSNEATEALEHAGARSREIAGRLDDLERREKELSATLEKLEKDESEKRVVLQEIDATMRELADTDSETRSGLESARSRAFDAAARKTETRNAIGALESEENILSARSEKLAGRLASIEADEATAIREEYSTLSEAAWYEAVEADALETAAEVSRREDELRGKRESLETDAAGLAAEYARVSARHDVVRDMVNGLEGVSAGARALREMKENDPDAWTGMRGITAELIDVQGEYAAAIEAALGASADAVLFNNPETAARARDVLRETGEGGAIFMTMPAIVVHGRRPAIEDPDCIGCIADLVTLPEDIRGVLDPVIGDAVLVKDFSAARRLAANPGPELRFITPDGEVVHRHGTWRAGSAGDGGGLLARRGELATLTAEMDALAGRLDALESDAAGIAASERTLAAEKRNLSDDADDAARMAAGLETAGREARRKIDSLVRERKVILSEHESLERDILGLAGKRSKLTRDLDEAERVERESTAAVADYNSRLEEITRRRDEVREDAGRLKVDLARVVENMQSHRAALADTAREMKEKTGDAEKLAHEIEMLAARRAESEKAVEESRTRITELDVEKEALSVEVADLDKKRGAMKETMNADRVSLKAAEKEAHKAAATAEDARLAASEVKLKIENLRERFASETGEDLDEAARSAGDPDVDEEGEEIIPLAYNWSAMKGIIDELSGKLGRIGNVNMDALDELAGLEERTSFLQGQYDDLDRAKNQLQDVIRKTNRKTRAMFTETFDAVRANFQVIFRKLFGGGKADVIMEEGTDVLDAGIEITAKPPGKENRSISLLSGGEKVMTSVALLFAIFKSRPSPVCLLDEVDAALDEANVDRFTAMLDEFLSESQFLIITHNKRTMAQADVLYGVTMQENGVSKPLVMEFEEAAKHADLPEERRAA